MSTMLTRVCGATSWRQGLLSVALVLLPLPGSDQSPTEVLQELESRWAASIRSTSASRPSPSTDLSDSQPAWMAPQRGPRLHWSQRQQLQTQQQQQPARQPRQLPSDTAIDVLGAFGNHPRQAKWRTTLWELAGAAFFNRQHRVLWWRILHGCVMCGAFRAYVGRATPEQACFPFACCSAPTQPQTISHMLLDCPVAAAVVSWLCRLWQAMTGCMPAASVATILAASVSEGQCALDARLQTWHRLRLAVLHSIWTAACIATSCAHASTPPTASSSSYSRLASKMALKTVVSMIRNDWVKCSDDVRQDSGVCSSWLRGKDPSMTLDYFKSMWCHRGALASLLTVQAEMEEDKLELVVHLSDSSPVLLH